MQINDLEEFGATEELRWNVEAEQVGTRLDRFLTSVMSDLSRSNIQQFIIEEAVLVNGKASKSGYALRLGDTIHVLRATPLMPLQEIVPRAIPLDVVYEDNDLLIVNKAPGMVVHPAPGHYDDTLVNALVARYPELQATEGDLRPGIVHRLDRDTSGLLIVAKNVRTQAELVDQMKQRKIEKRYLALVEGVLSLDSGTIDAPIGRDPRHRQLMAVVATGSREARTHFRVMERYHRHTLVQLQLETGRTHQIRVHLKAINHPVVGDLVYGASGKNLPVPLRRQFLHAHQLRFAHPHTGSIVEVEAPLPRDLQAVLDRSDAL